MIKRVNFTGRRRIPQRHAKIEIPDGKPPTFNAAIDLDGMQMPSKAKVFLEAISVGSTLVRRFDFGTVGAIEVPKDRSLDGFDPDHVLFALKVVDQSERIGRILGAAQNIRPERIGNDEPSESKGILPIVESDELGQQLWDLDFREHFVCLRVNKNIPGLKDRAHWDSTVYSLVYPAVVREVLRKAIEWGAEYDEQSDHWAVLWLRFGRDLHPTKESPPTFAGPSDEDVDGWIEEVVQAFCDRHALKDIYLSRLPKDDGGDV